MKMQTFLGLTLIGILAACGCGEKARDVTVEEKKGEKKREDKDSQKGEPNKDKEKNGKASTGGWGTVKGKITYEAKAKLPANPEVNVTNDKAFCLEKGKIYRDEWVIDPKSKGIKNVIVWLSHEDPEEAQKPNWPAKLIHEKLTKVPEELVLDQPVCAFMPRAIALREGTKLTFKNSATVAHNVKIDGGDLGPKINTLIPPGQSISETSIKARFIPIEVSCTIHPWMKSWLISFKHPYFAVTNDKGEFEIENAPTGNYRLQIWHEHYGFIQKNKNDRGIEITIKDKAAIEVNRELVKED